MIFMIFLWFFDDFYDFYDFYDFLLFFHEKLYFLNLKRKVIQLYFKSLQKNSYNQIVLNEHSKIHLF